MLMLHSISRYFGATRAIDGISLEIPQGQMIGIIGRSGAGKSTLLRLVNRLVDPSDGRIVFGDTDVTGLRGRALLEWRARCAMIFQQFNLVNRLDVLTNVLLGRVRQHGTLPSMFKRFSDAERTMALEALEWLDLLPQALQRADTLSGGQQQRVAIARALVQEPQVMLADEPIASLDPRNAQMVMAALQAINRDAGITVICNLHTLETARSYCERIIGMAHGRIVFDASPEALTAAKVREVYGIDKDDAAFREDIGDIPPIGPSAVAQGAVAAAAAG